MAAVSTAWRCRKHEKSVHDIFISYRRNPDKDIAYQLWTQLSLSEQAPKVFLDSECLNFGEDWYIGFQHGLVRSRVVVLVISADCLERIKSAHLEEDNVLLEWEQAIAAKHAGTLMVCPLLVGNFDGVRAFQFPSLDNFADQKPHRERPVMHINDNPHLTRFPTVRETVRSVFALNGPIVGRQDDIRSCVFDIIGTLRRAPSPVIAQPIHWQVPVPRPGPDPTTRTPLIPIPPRRPGRPGPGTVPQPLPPLPPLPRTICGCVEPHSGLHQACCIGAWLTSPITLIIGCLAGSCYGCCYVNYRFPQTPCYRPFVHCTMLAMLEEQFLADEIEAGKH